MREMCICVCIYLATSIKNLRIILTYIWQLIDRGSVFAHAFIAMQYFMGYDLYGTMISPTINSSSLSSIFT